MGKVTTPPIWIYNITTGDFTEAFQAWEQKVTEVASEKGIELGFIPDRPGEVFDMWVSGLSRALGLYPPSSYYDHLGYTTDQFLTWMIDVTVKLNT